MRNRRANVQPVSEPSNGGMRAVAEGFAEEVTTDGLIRVVIGRGQTLLCRVPMHISLPWLRAALARGPVAAEVTVSDGGGQPSLGSLFPGREHDGVIPENIEIAASQGIHLVCGNSKITMVGKELRVRSRDVTVGGSRATRVRGGTVKLN